MRYFVLKAGFGSNFTGPCHPGLESPHREPNESNQAHLELCNGHQSQLQRTPTQRTEPRTDHGLTKLALHLLIAGSRSDQFTDGFGATDALTARVAFFYESWTIKIACIRGDVCACLCLHRVTTHASASVTVCPRIVSKG